ncbi:MAG TPA: DHHA1 domain-containing protein [Acidobacteriaceae bacterium]|nr:DHHA1 domain-containing protein [Acidobacteriaceae bacterium]
MPVSERLYYSEPFLKTFAAAVTDVRELARQDGESIWQVALDRTAFYPTSGGQPFDTGTLRATSRGGAALDIPVESVEEDEAGEVWHYVRKPLSAGTQVEGSVDWERRFDHMQQHTGQHVLSAIFLAQYHAPTVSFHLGDTVSTIDLATASVSPRMLEEVERAVNRIIGEDRAVGMRYVPRAEAEAMLAAGVLRKLPEREGEIRLIEIADCDHNACGGTHVRSTGQIGGLLVRGVEKVTRGYRVEFFCGLRAVATARADAAILGKLTASLSAGAPDIPAAVERLKAEARSGAKERQRLREELAGYHASRLAVEVPIEKGVRLVDRSWKDRDRDYVRVLASRLTAAAPETAAILSAEEGTTVRVILARSLDLDFDCGKIMKEALAQFGLRGGGSSDLAQGDISVQDAPALRAALVQTIRASTHS